VEHVMATARAAKPAGAGKDRAEQEADVASRVARDAGRDEHNGDSIGFTYDY
jgi:hypothetical protein